MWQDATSVKQFIQRIPDEVHCLFMSYSGNSDHTLLHMYLFYMLLLKRAALAYFLAV